MQSYLWTHTSGKVREQRLYLDPTLQASELQPPPCKPSTAQGCSSQSKSPTEVSICWVVSTSLELCSLRGVWERLSQAALSLICPAGAQ